MVEFCIRAYAPGRGFAVEIDPMHTPFACRNHQSHLHIHRYQVYDDSDFVFDYPSATDPIHDASIKIKFDRLKLLIDMSLQ